jgi:hypothetical protein
MQLDSHLNQHRGLQFLDKIGCLRGIERAIAKKNISFKWLGLKV